MTGVQTCALPIFRRKIEPDPQDATMIKTVRSGGYMFTPAVEPLPMPADSPS